MWDISPWRAIWNKAFGLSFNVDELMEMENVKAIDRTGIRGETGNPLEMATLAVCEISAGWLDKPVREEFVSYRCGGGSTIEPAEVPPRVITAYAAAFLAQSGCNLATLSSSQALSLSRKAAWLTSARFLRGLRL